MLASFGTLGPGTVNVPFAYAYAVPPPPPPPPQSDVVLTVEGYGNSAQMFAPGQRVLYSAADPVRLYFTLHNQGTAPSVIKSGSLPTGVAVYEAAGAPVMANSTGSIAPGGSRQYYLLLNAAPVNDAAGNPTVVGASSVSFSGYGKAAYINYGRLSGLSIGGFLPSWQQLGLTAVGAGAAYLYAKKPLVVALGAVAGYLLGEMLDKGTATPLNLGV